MDKLFWKIIVMVSLHVSWTNGGFIGDAVTGIGERTVGVVATPVQETVVKTALYNCEPVKAILGVRYRDLKGDIDTSGLALDFYSGLSMENMQRFNLSDSTTRTFTSQEVDFNEPVYFFLHGFLSSSTGDAPTEVIKAFKTMGHKNIFALDSSSLISFFYLRSSTVVSIIGEQLGKTMAGLVKGGISPDRIHIIGHSLGAHISGFTGKMFQNITGHKIGRITGLDPAGPCFFKKNPAYRLNKDDAKFVDVIHSDSGVFGIIDPLGHTDFFPNGGKMQAGCLIPPCSHGRAWELFAQSVLNPNRFSARQCVGWDTFLSGGCNQNEVNHMGFGADPNKEGQFYLETKGKAPFDIDEATPAEKTLLGKIF